MFTRVTAPQSAKRAFEGRSTSVRPRVAINAPGDAYEREADAIADAVMGTTSPKNAMAPRFGGPPGTVQRECAACHEDEREVRRKESSGGGVEASASMNAYVSSLAGAGRPLSERSREFFEPRFRYDFSHVRVHADGAAARSAASIHALAYTTGRHIVFGQGQYAPGTPRGDRLLAHELAHIIQQDASPSTTPRIQRACTAAELAALNATMHGFCDQPRRCNMSTDTCATATAKVAAGYGCTSLRTLIQQKCFKPGDPRYENHMKQLAREYAALRNCQAVMSAKCAEEEAAREEAEAQAEAQAEAEAEAAEATETTAAAEEGITLLDVLEVAGGILAL
jgi:Domain of unknown function (DUF4157)/Novel toxin 16